MHNTSNCLCLSLFFHMTHPQNLKSQKHMYIRYNSDGMQYSWYCIFYIMQFAQIFRAGLMQIWEILAFPLYMYCVAYVGSACAFKSHPCTPTCINHNANTVCCTECLIMSYNLMGCIAYNWQMLNENAME